MFRTMTILAAALSLMAQTAAAQRRWVWMRDSVITRSGLDYELTENTGGRAVALARYMDGQTRKTWMTSVYVTDDDDVRAYCYRDMIERADEAVVRTPDEPLMNAVVAIPGTRKVAAWVEENDDGDDQVYSASQALTTVSNDWPHVLQHHLSWGYCKSGHVALAAHGTDRVYVVYEEEYEEEENGEYYDYYHLRFRRSMDQGQNWDVVRRNVVTYSSRHGHRWAKIAWPSLAVNENSIDTTYIAYYVVDPDGDRDTVVFRRSTDGGEGWSGHIEMATIPTGKAAGVCVAAHKNLVVVLWSEETDGRYQVKYRTSTTSGNTFTAAQSLPLRRPWTDWDKMHPNATIVRNDDGQLCLLLTTQDRDATDPSRVRYGVGMIYARWLWSSWEWDQRPHWFNQTYDLRGDYMSPSMQGLDFEQGAIARAVVVWSDPRHATSGIWRARGVWGFSGT